MNKNNLFSGISILIMGIAIVLSSYLIGNAIKSNNNTYVKKTKNDSKVLNLSQVADYLNMTEQEVKAIIEIEKKELKNTGSFTGEMFPYFSVDNKFYFCKDEINVWLHEVTTNHRYYDTNEFTCYNN